jgi:hypothetical protein
LTRRIDMYGSKGKTKLLSIVSLTNFDDVVKPDTSCSKMRDDSDTDEGNEELLANQGKKQK